MDGDPRGIPDWLGHFPEDQPNNSDPGRSVKSKTWVAEGNFVWMTRRDDGRNGEASLLLVLPQKSMLLGPSMDIYMVDHSMIEGREGGDDNGSCLRVKAFEHGRKRFKITKY